MKIGIVLAQTPQYSETFFISKIKGLQTSGHTVILFVQRANPHYNLCKVVEAPKQIKRYPLLQFIKMAMVLFGFILGHPKRFYQFIQLERAAQRSWLQLVKNLYHNVHLLSSNLDWLHFGFATMALQREHIAKAIGTKMAVSFRGYDMDVYPLKFPGCYDLLWKRVDKVHSISEYLLHKAYAIGLLRTVPYQIITPAIDINTFKNAWPNTTTPIKFLSVARLEWIKGLSYTLEALAKLKQQGISFHYTIIGDGKAREELVFSIHQLDLKEDVTLLAKRPHDGIVSHLSNTDVYLQYSISEGFCNAVLEAQAMGCLCVVSDGGALAENVLHEQTGWVVAKRNAPLLSHTLMQVLNLADTEREAIRVRARKRVEAHFNSEQQKMAFSLFYKIEV